MKDQNHSFQIKPFLLLLAVALFAGFCVPSTEGSLKNPLYLAILLVFGLALTAFLVVPAIRRRMDAKAAGQTGDDSATAAQAGSAQNGVPSATGQDGGQTVSWKRAWLTLTAMLAGFFVKLCYVLYTQTWDRQHDVVSFGAGEGQAAYIEYFLTYKSLPDFDPRSIWGFFQPPLHHIISAVWMKINLFLGLSERQAQENVQILTFFYMGALMILTYFVCRELEFEKTGTCIAVSTVSLHPVFILLSGSINNDALSLFLMMLSLYLAIVWFKRPRIMTIILLALSIGLAMFAKLSGGMIAPAVASLFIIKLIREKGKRGQFILQYVIFGVICVPVGLFWTVRNMLLYNMPVNYIPEVGQQFGEMPLYVRLFDLHMDSVFPAMLENGDSFYEHNIFLAIIKTSLFGEYNYANLHRAFTIPAVFLFLSATVLALIAFGVTLFLLFSKRSSLQSEWRWFFGILYFTILASYLSFALSYSNFSAQDFRYAALLIVVEALLLGIFTDHLDLQKEGPKQIFPIITGATAIFCACSFVLYFLLGFFKP